jgi:hypothetical protein
MRPISSDEPARLRELGQGETPPSTANCARSQKPAGQQAEGPLAPTTAYEINTQKSAHKICVHRLLPLLPFPSSGPWLPEKEDNYVGSSLSRCHTRGRRSAATLVVGSCKIIDPDEVTLAEQAADVSELEQQEETKAAA